MFQRHVSSRASVTRSVSTEESIGTLTEADIRSECEGELLKFRSAVSLMAFIDDDCMKEMNDPMLWWKFHAGKFGKVWLLAKYYLAIPATSVLSERCFSGARRILNAARSGTAQSNNFEESYTLSRNMDLLPTTPIKK